MEKDRKLFVGKLIPGSDIVHNVLLQGTQRKFEIISIIDAKKWENFDEDKHMEGTFIAWDLKDTQVKVSVCTNTHTLIHKVSDSCTLIMPNLP